MEGGRVGCVGKRMCWGGGRERREGGRKEERQLGSVGWGLRDIRGEILILGDIWRDLRRRENEGISILKFLNFRSFGGKEREGENTWFFSLSPQ